MRAKIVNIPFHPGIGGFDDAELQRELAVGEPETLQARFVDAGERCVLSCLLVWRESGESEPAHATARERAPKVVRAKKPGPELAGPDRAVFERLRGWRRDRARELGVPAYRVLTDRQLASVASLRPLDDAALSAVEGIGAARAASCGPSLFSALRAAFEAA